jgi:hypothetical protein
MCVRRMAGLVLFFSLCCCVRVSMTAQGLNTVARCSGFENLIEKPGFLILLFDREEEARQ